jgi:hypothetical protein
MLNSDRNDCAIIAAWAQYRAARLAADTLPDEADADIKAQFAIMDAQAAIIVSTIATTLRGVEIKLWLALTDRHLTWSDDVEQARCEDIAALSLPGAECGDRDEIVSAIRSLRAMEAAR